MSFWSNIQAAWVGWGRDWKNHWIAPYKNFYKDYLLHDLLLNRYLKLKIKQDDNLNISFMYNYDFFFEKTFFYSKIILERYNIDLSRLSQLAYVAWITMLNFGSDLTSDNKFYWTSMFNAKFINFFFWPVFFFYNYNLFLLKKSIDEINTEFNWITNLPFLQRKLLLGLWTASFFVECLFSNPNLFFVSSPLLNYKNLSEIYENHNVPKDVSFTNSLEIYQNWFTLANFLFNPMILKKYPNFVFLYQNWLHKSWISSKKTTLMSIKLSHSYINITNNVLINMDYFYSRYIRFFFFMRQINLFFQGTGDSGVGISKEFLTKQKEIFYLRLQIWDIMIYNIWKVWSYLKAYLKYFSYEGKMRIFWSKLVFKWLFFFKNFLRSFITGYKFSVNTFLIILKKLYILKIFKKINFFKLMGVFFKYPKLMLNWIYFLNKFFFKSVKFLKKILKKWKLTFLKKLELLNGFFNFFNYKIGTNNLIIGYFKPLFKFSFKLILEKINLKENLNYLENLKKIPLTFNLLILFYFFNLFRKINKNPKSTLVEYRNIFEKNISIKTKIFKNFQKFLFFGDNFNTTKDLLTSSEWLLVCIIPSEILWFFYLYIYFKWTFWFKKFIYFYYYLSNLSIKAFFWIFMDLLSLLNFNLLIHLIIIFWQNFFFFYLFVLKCLRSMYSLCDHNKQLFLSRPVKLFLQKSNWETVMLDFFSNSFQFFGPFLPIPFLQKYWEDRMAFTLIDFSYGLSQLGKPNCWMLNNTKQFLPFNKFSLFDKISDTPIFLPFLNITFSSLFFFRKKNKYFFDKKFWINLNYNFFSSWVPTHLKIKYFSNLLLTSNLIATFIKKKLEKDHLIVEILWSLNLLLLQSDTIWGFMFLLKGRFSRRERASKIWLKKGKLKQTNIWTKLDYCKLPAKLKYGTASVWVWLVIETSLDDKIAFV